METVVLGIVLAVAGLIMRYRCRMRMAYIEEGLRGPPDVFDMPNIHAEMQEAAAAIEVEPEMADDAGATPVVDCSV